MNRLMNGFDGSPVILVDCHYDSAVVSLQAEEHVEGLFRE